MRLARDQVVTGAVRPKAVIGAVATDTTRLLELEDALEGLIVRARNDSPPLQNAQEHKSPSAEVTRYEGSAAGNCKAQLEQQLTLIGR